MRSFLWVLVLCSVIALLPGCGVPPPDIRYPPKVQLNVDWQHSGDPRDPYKPTVYVSQPRFELFTIDARGDNEKAFKSEEQFLRGILPAKDAQPGGAEKCNQWAPVLVLIDGGEGTVWHWQMTNKVNKVRLVDPESKLIKLHVVQESPLIVEVYCPLQDEKESGKRPCRLVLELDMKK